VVLWEGFDETMLQNVSAAQGQKKVGLYCSHTDESYIPGDGTEAKPEKGGIIDVTNALADQLNKRGIKAVADDTPHDPHDAGAYRRSRSSAMNLMESVQPDLLLDIHRDGVPNAKEYDDTINGKQASKCRFVIGRGNQNKMANEDTAKKMKQIADTTYPGLVKDIYIGHGSYNQDLTPNSMIIEIGTHTIEKSRVMESTGYIADVIAKYLGVSGADGQSAAPGASGQPQVRQEAQKTPSANKSAAAAIAWTVGIVGAALLIFLLVATVNGERRQRVGNFFREVTGIGRRRDRDK
jgi:stage II sporulation protein P